MSSCGHNDVFAGNYDCWKEVWCKNEDSEKLLVDSNTDIC